MLGLAAFAASYIACALLALRQGPHLARVAEARRAQPSAAARRQNLWLGAAALALSFVFCCIARGPSFGAILWVLLLAAAGSSVMFTLTYRPRWLRPLQRDLSR